MRPLLPLSFLLCLITPAAMAQQGSFDSILLDNANLNPFIEFTSPDDDDHFIVGFNSRLGFYVNNSYKFDIYDSALSSGLKLDADGVTAKKQIHVQFASGPARQFEVEHTNNQSFAVTSLSSTQTSNGGAIGFATDSAYAPFMVFDTAKNETLSVRDEGVGVGTFDATEPLHIYADGLTNFGKAKVLVENNHSGSPVPRNMFALVNNGAARFSITDTSNFTSWVFSSNSNGAFSFSKDGTGGSEFLILPSGRVMMGPGGVRNFDLKPNGNLTIAGTLTQSSDKALKTAFVSVDANDILQRVANMPVSTWQFKFDDPELRHMGPTAQDFRAAFGLGQDEKTLAPVDGIGVSLAAIKALNQKADIKDQRIAELNETVNDQSRRLTRQERRIAEQDKLLRLLSERLNDLETKVDRPSM